jgi:hypothetical protein
MAIDFREVLDLPPIPFDARRAALQAVEIARKIEGAGSVAAAKASAVQAIRDNAQNDPPSELGRLRSLYTYAYTDVELAGLVSNTFRSLGLDGGEA